MQWRSIGAAGEPYPAWLRELKGKSGAYAIRRNGWVTSSIVYVGESHTGQLYKTLTRHFQTWRRGKAWWRGQFVAEQTDPGHTYKRAECEVAIKICAPSEAVELQDKWIRRLSPRDNRAGLEEAPF